jgi:chromosome segregation ATPase
LAQEALNRPDRPIEEVQRDLNARLAELEQMRGQITAKEREINLLLMELSKLHMREKRKTVLRARKQG